MQVVYINTKRPFKCNLCKHKNARYHELTPAGVDPMTGKGRVYFTGVVVCTLCKKTNGHIRSPYPDWSHKSLLRERQRYWNEHIIIRKPA